MDVQLRDFEMSDSETELLLDPVNKRSETIVQTVNTRNRRKRSIRMEKCMRIFCG